jgi:hypothetical protein
MVRNRFKAHIKQPEQFARPNTVRHCIQSKMVTITGIPKLSPVAMVEWKMQLLYRSHFVVNGSEYAPAVTPPP